jgi:hypothetical protein
MSPAGSAASRASTTRFEYLEERKAALGRWSEHVEGLLRPATVNVVSLRSAP